MRTYRDGTLSLVNASTTITGVGTLFVANVGIGDIIICENSQCFEVVSITDNTHLVVDVAAKQTGSFKYGCLRFVTAVNFRDLSVKIEQFLTDRQTNLAEFTTWMTGTKTGGPTSNGLYPLTDRFGVVRQYQCPELLAQGYADSVVQATAAAASATAANSSKVAAAASQTAAGTSATNAASSATAANTSKVNAGTSETNALASKNAAAASATAAATSATNASTSETNALASKNAAAVSASLAVSGLDKMPDNWIANPGFDATGTLNTTDTVNGKVDYVDRDTAGVPVGFSSARVARSLKKVAAQLTYSMFPVIGPTSYIPTMPGQVFDVSIEVAVVSGTALPAGNGSARFVVIETALDGSSSINTRVLSYDNNKGGFQVLTGSFATQPTTYKMTVGMWNESNMPANATMYYGSPVIRKRDAGLAVLQGRMANMIPDPTYSGGTAAWQPTFSIYDKTAAGVPAGASSPHVAKIAVGTAITYLKMNRDPAHAILELPVRTNGVQAAEGDVFEFSARVYLDVATPRLIRFNVDFINAANAATNVSASGLTIGAADGWQTLTGFVTVPAGNIGICPQLRVDAGTACDLYVGELHFGRTRATNVQLIKDRLAVNGIGADAPAVSDLNDTSMTSGLYRYGSTALNSPFPGQSGTVLHSSYNSTYIGQLALHMGQGTTVSNKLIYRSMVNGAWNPWIELVSTSYLGTTVGFGPLNVNGVLIPAATDLNTYQTPGAYGQNLSASATLALNYPATRAGALFVLRASNNMIMQMYFDYQNGRSWNRSLYQTTWSAWVRNAQTDNETFVSPTLADAVMTGMSRFVALANSTDATLVPSSSDTGNSGAPVIRIAGSAATMQNTIAVQGYSFSTINLGSTFIGTRSYGATGVHGAVANQRSACTLMGAASDGTEYRRLGRIDFYTEAIPSDTSSPGSVRISTTSPGSVIPTLAATFTQDGHLNVVGGGTYNAKLNVTAGGAAITGATSITGATTISGNLDVTGDINAIGTKGILSGYRLGVYRNGGTPYMTFARSDLADGTPPATDTTVMTINGKTASADVNNFDGGRLLGALDVTYLSTGGGRTRTWARNAAGATTALFTQDGEAGTNTMLGNLIASNRIDARGSIDEAVTATVASATTTDIALAQANTISITGTTTITGLGTTTVGVRREVKFAGILTLTHNATKLNLPGNANIVTAAGDYATFTSKGSGNWDCTDYVRANGVSINSVAGVTTLPGNVIVNGVIDEAATQTLASAATLNLATVTSNTVNVTGTTTITSFGTDTAGVRRLLKFAASLTLTHNATSLIIPGGVSIVTGANDIAEVMCLGGANWIVYNYTQFDGAAILVTNLNTVTKSGKYRIASTGTGLPAVGDCLVEHSLMSTGFAMQVAINIATNVKYHRVQVSGTWGPWVKDMGSSDVVGSVNTDTTVGAIMEQGQTGNNWYVRFASGVQWCWGIAPDISAPAAGAAVVAPQCNFAAAFIDNNYTPFQFGTPNISGDVYGFIYVTTFATTYMVNVYRNGATAPAQTITNGRYMVIGRWK